MATTDKISSYEVVKLLKQTDNRLCADCSAPLAQPPLTFASLTHGVWICAQCAEIHRQHLPGSEVKAATERWTSSEIKIMQDARSNDARNAVLERYQPAVWDKISPAASADERKQWIRAKYYSHFFSIPQENVPGAEERGKAATTSKNNKTKKKKRKVDRKERVENVSVLPSRLADYFLVLGPGELKTHDLSAFSASDLSESEIERLEFQIDTLDCCPEKDFHEDTPLPELVGPMVFPQGLTLSAREKPPFVFSFVLTDVNRVKLYGTTLVFHELVERERVHAWLAESSLSLSAEQRERLSSRVLYAPKALVVLSHYAFFQLFTHFLTETYHVSLSQSSLPLERFVLNFMEEVPLPPQGRVEVLVSLAQRTLAISRPPRNQLPMVDFSFQPLFAHLHVDTILTVFQALCLEMTICICASNIALLTPIQEALLSLLFPFVWQGCYVPILPEHMLELLDAPVPLLVGVHDKFLSQTTHETRPVNVLYVHVDRDEILFREDEQRTISTRLALTMPKRTLSKLRGKLVDHGACVHRRVDHAARYGTAGLPFPHNEHLVPIKGLIFEQGGRAAHSAVAQYSTAQYASSMSKLGVRRTTQPALTTTSGGSGGSEANSESVSAKNAASSPAMKFFSSSSTTQQHTPQSQPQAHHTAPSHNTTTAVPYRHPAASTLTTAAAAAGERERESERERSPLDPENNFDGSDAPGHFNAKEIRDAFLRFFVASFGDYQDFLKSDESVFDSAGFIATLQDDFLAEMVHSQMFTNFLTERSESPDTPEIRFFDENLLAKKNRSKLSLSKTSTPFLSDDTDFLREIFTAPTPSSAGLTLEESTRGFVYASFPALHCDAPCHADTVRPAKRLISHEQRKRMQDKNSKAASVLEQQIMLLLSNASAKQHNGGEVSYNSNSALSESETVVSLADQESAFLEMALDRYAQVITALARFQHYVKYVRRVRREYLAMRRARQTVWAFYWRCKRERTRRYKLFARQIVRIQRHVRGYLARVRVKRIRWLIVKIQSRWRQLRLSRAYYKIRAHIVRIQAVQRGHATRVKAHAARVQSLALYRAQLPLLWTLSHTSLSQRSHFWLCVRDATFLSLSLCQKELRRMYGLLGFSSSTLQAREWERKPLDEQVRVVNDSKHVKALRALCVKHTSDAPNKSGERVAWKQLVPEICSLSESAINNTNNKALVESERKERETLYSDLQTLFADAARAEQEKRWFDAFQVAKHKFRKRKLSRYVWMHCEDAALCDLSARLCLSVEYAVVLPRSSNATTQGEVSEDALRDVASPWLTQQRRACISQHTVETLHAFLSVLRELKKENRTLRIALQEEQQRKRETKERGTVGTKKSEFSTQSGKF